MTIMQMLFAKSGSTSAAPVYVGGTTGGWVGTTANQTVSMTGLTGGIASQPSENDIVVVLYAAGSTVDRTLTFVTASYNTLVDQYVSSTFDVNFLLGWKRMGSTPDTQVQVSGTGNAADAGAVAIHVWRGVDTVIAIDTTTTQSNSATSGIPTPPAITTTTNNCVVIAACASAHNGGVDTYTAFGNMTNGQTSGGANDTNDITVGLASNTVDTNSTFTPTAWTWSQTNSATYSNYRATLALRSATP